MLPQYPKIVHLKECFAYRVNWHGFVDFRKTSKICRPMGRGEHGDGTIDVKVVVQFVMRIDHAARLAIGSRERWESVLRVVERTGDQWRVLRPFQRYGWRAGMSL